MNCDLREVLDRKGRAVFSVTRDTTVSKAVSLMNDRHIGSVLVAEDKFVWGIFTERDVLVRVVEPDLDPAFTQVAAVMTPCPRCVRPSMSVCDALQLMTETRQRHLPVCEARQVVGLVSLGDLVHHIGCVLERQVQDLTGLVHGPYAKPPTSVFPEAPWSSLPKPPVGVAA